MPIICIKNLKEFESIKFVFLWIAKSHMILFFAFCLIVFSQSIRKQKCFSNLVGLKNEINIIRNKRRSSNSPGCYPILYNPGMFQNHPVMCWQLVQMSGMRVIEHLCPSELNGWAHKQPALYFIYLHLDKAIFPVFIILPFLLWIQGTLLCT